MVTPLGPAGSYARSVVRTAVPRTGGAAAGSAYPVGAAGSTVVDSVVVVRS